MKKTKWRLFALLTLALIVLAGCGQRKQTNAGKKATSRVSAVKKQKSASKTKKVAKSSSSSKAAAKVTAKPKSTTPWDTTKDQQLAAFIKQWAPKMGQDYTKYDGHTPLQTSVGVTYPADLAESKIDGASVSIGWSPTGEGKYAYNVVAIYNYDGTEPPLPNRITYVFAFHNKQPVALVDQSRDGGPSLTPTQNADVRNAFDKIASGSGSTTATQATASSSQTKQLDPKIVGVLLDEMTGADLNSPFLHFGNNTKIYPYIIDEQTADSQVPFRIDGATVHYGVRDPNYDTAANVFNDRTVSLQFLRDKYYHTKAQQKTVQQVVGKMSLN